MATTRTPMAVAQYYFKCMPQKNSMGQASLVAFQDVEAQAGRMRYSRIIILVAQQPLRLAEHKNTEEYRYLIACVLRQ